MTKYELIEQLSKSRSLPKSEIINQVIMLLQRYINDTDIDKALWEINFKYNNYNE